MKRSFIVFILIVCLIRCNISLRAQAPFSIRYEFIGCSDNQIDGTATAVVNSLINGYISKYASGVKMTRQACEALRSAIPNTIEVGYGCRVKVIMGGCSGFDAYGNGVNSITGNNDIFGVSKGQSNFVINPALANQYSVEDHTYALDVLIGNRGASPGITYATTADQSYNNALDHIFIKGKLPEEQWYIPDEYITGDKKFVPMNMREDWGTPDLLFDEDVKIAPVKSVKTYYEEPKETMVDWTIDLLGSIADIGFDIGDMAFLKGTKVGAFLKGAGIGSTILVHANVAVWKSVYDCWKVQCTSYKYIGNSIAKNMLGVDAVKWTEKSKEYYNENYNGTEGGLGKFMANVESFAITGAVDIKDNIVNGSSDIITVNLMDKAIDYGAGKAANKLARIAGNKFAVKQKGWNHPVSGNSMQYFQISTATRDIGLVGVKVNKKTEEAINNYQRINNEKSN